MVKIQFQKKPLKKPVRKTKISQKQKQKQNVTVNINPKTRSPPSTIQKVIQRPPHSTTVTPYTNLSFTQPATNNNDSLLLRELFTVNKELQKKLNTLEKREPTSQFEKNLASYYIQANGQLDDQILVNEYTVLGTPEARAQREQQKKVAQRAIPDNPLLRGLRDAVGPSFQVAPSGIFKEQLEASLGFGELPFVTSSVAPRSGLGSLNQVTNMSGEERLDTSVYRGEALKDTRRKAVSQPELKLPFNSLEASLHRATSDGLPSERTPILETYSNDPVEQGQETYAEAPDRRQDGQHVLGAQEIPNRLGAYIAENQTTGALLEQQRGEEVTQLAPIAKDYAVEGEDMEEGADGDDAETVVQGLGAPSSSASASTENIFSPPKANSMRTYLVGIAKANKIVHSDNKGTFTPKKIKEALDKAGITY